MQEGTKAFLSIFVITIIAAVVVAVHPDGGALGQDIGEWARSRSEPQPEQTERPRRSVPERQPVTISEPMTAEEATALAEQDVGDAIKAAEEDLGRTIRSIEADFDSAVRQASGR